MPRRWRLRSAGGLPTRASQPAQSLRSCHSTPKPHPRPPGPWPPGRCDGPLPARCWPRRVDGAPGEVPAFQPLLDGLDLAGVVMTADALYTPPDPSPPSASPSHEPRALREHAAALPARQAPPVLGKPPPLRAAERSSRQGRARRVRSASWRLKRSGCSRNRVWPRPSARRPRRSGRWPGRGRPSPSTTVSARPWLTSKGTRSAQHVVAVDLAGRKVGADLRRHGHGRAQQRLDLLGRVRRPASP